MKEATNDALRTSRGGGGLIKLNPNNEMKQNGKGFELESIGLANFVNSGCRNRRSPRLPSDLDHPRP